MAKKNDYNKGYCDGIEYALKMFESYKKLIDAHDISFIKDLSGSKGDK